MCRGLPRQQLPDPDPDPRLQRGRPVQNKQPGQLFMKELMPMFNVMAIRNMSLIARPIEDSDTHHGDARAHSMRAKGPGDGVF